MRFSDKGAVPRHERTPPGTDTGEKPYASSMCPRRFAHKSAVSQDTPLYPPSIHPQ